MVATCLGTRRDKALNFCFGIFPFSSAVLISRMREGSVRSQSWFSLIPLEFGNAVVLQTNLSGSGIKHCFLIFSVTQSRSWYKIQMTVGTGFAQLFRGIGQVGDVAISSALFQARLDAEPTRPMLKKAHHPVY
ncbi:hypothetical protein B0H11DRAFT_931153 [Mycena galericulata]|nr:hypothetical protein B0H11DRAFT_931153 [Mycena galericulata]